MIKRKSIFSQIQLHYDQKLSLSSDEKSQFFYLFYSFTKLFDSENLSCCLFSNRKKEALSCSIFFPTHCTTFLVDQKYEQFNQWTSTRSNKTFFLC